MWAGPVGLVFDLKTVDLLYRTVSLSFSILLYVDWLQKEKNCWIRAGACQRSGKEL